MRKIIVITSLLFSILFSPPSFSKWEIVKEGNGSAMYIDIERIRKIDGYVYYWELSDFQVPIMDGINSVRAYYKGDCKLLRTATLTYFWHKEQMGKGIAEEYTPPEQKWRYPPPHSSGETVLNFVCNR